MNNFKRRYYKHFLFEAKNWFSFLALILDHLTFTRSCFMEKDESVDRIRSGRKSIRSLIV